MSFYFLYKQVRSERREEAVKGAKNVKAKKSKTEQAGKVKKNISKSYPEERKVNSPKEKMTV